MSLLAPEFISVKHQADRGAADDDVVVPNAYVPEAVKEEIKSEILLKEEQVSREIDPDMAPAVPGSPPSDVPDVAAESDGADPAGNGDHAGSGDS